MQIFVRSHYQNKGSRVKNLGLFCFYYFIYSENWDIYPCLKHYVLLVLVYIYSQIRNWRLSLLKYFGIRKDNRALYLDDLKIGDTFISEKYQLNADEIKEFAREFDPQDFHCDEDLAEDTFFGELVASGWHTAAITMKLFTASMPLADGLIGAGGEIKWPQPTRPNDALYVKSTIKEIIPSKSKPNQGLLIVECKTLNQKDEVCQTFLVKMISFRKS